MNDKKYFNKFFPFINYEEDSQSTEKTVKLFVYGTLTPQNNNFDRLFKDYNVEYTKAHTYGTLYNVSGAYPALKKKGKNKIKGYLYTIKSNAQKMYELFYQLHKYESALGKYNLYNFEKIKIHNNKKKINAYAYIYNFPVNSLNIIQETSWQKFKTKNKEE